MADERIYAGIFADEAGQHLLATSLSQLVSTLGVAWDACKTKESPQTVFAECMDVVAGWPTQAFVDEASRHFSAQPRATESLRTAFIDYVKQMYGSCDRDRYEVRAGVPTDAIYVQALLSHGARFASLRDGRFFRVDSNLERKDVAMDVIRHALVQLCDEYVLVQERTVPEASVAPGAPTISSHQHDRHDDMRNLGDIGPDDSASMVSRAISRGSARGSSARGGSERGGSERSDSGGGGDGGSEGGSEGRSERSRERSSERSSERSRERSRERSSARASERDHDDGGDVATVASSAATRRRGSDHRSVTIKAST